MDQVELNAQPRSITGKKVKQLRENGMIPMVVYGRKTEPINVQSVEFDTRRLLAHVGGSLVALRIDGESEPRMVLARGAQRDVITGNLLHLDLYEVDMTAMLQVEVPLSFVGEPHLVDTGEALLIHILNAVEIECLPSAIMQSIEVDVSQLVDLDDAIHVRDLIVPEGVELVTDGDEMVARLEQIFEEEEEEEEEVAFGVPSAADVEVIQRGKVEEEE
jgi:large subunit ribosomal protein L25